MKGARVFGVDAALDRRAKESHVLLRDGERRAGGDLDLLVDDVDAGDHLGDRMLDLDARVHLDEEELAVLVEELDRPGADVAELAHRARDDPADLVALRRVESGRGPLLPDLLVAPLERAVALAEMDSAALTVAEHLKLDVAGLGEVFFEVDGVVAEGGLRFELGGGDRVGKRVGPARDLHAAPAPARRGLDDHRIADLAGYLERLLRPVTRAFEPGTQGMPRRSAVRLASILSPMSRMCSAFGPMKAISCSSRISAKRAFSDRKP